VPKRKTTILVDQDPWVDFMTLVMRKHGTSRKRSEEIEKTMREHLKKDK
jgi:hypothetical protein